MLSIVDENLVEILIKKKTPLFDSVPGENLSVFENILLSSHKKSAKYICLIWEEYQLWKKKELLTWDRSENYKLPVDFVLESTNIENFLSFLVFDWHNSDCHKANKEKKYFLELKNKQMIEKTGKSLFQKLYEIIENGDVYHEVCLRIIYEYLAEMNERVEKEMKVQKGKAETDDKEEFNGDVTKLLSIEDVLMMKNKEYQSKILAVFITYWNIFDDAFLSRKDDILKATNATVVEDPTFFSLAFLLIERKNNHFENHFTKFAVLTRKAYGNYHESILTPLVRLLLRISKKLKMTQVQTCIFHKCPYVEINSEPLKNFQEFYKFNNMNIFLLNEEEMDDFHEMEDAFESLKHIHIKFPFDDNETDKKIKKMKKLQRDKYKHENLEVFQKHLKITANKDGTGFSTSRNLLFEHHGYQNNPRASLFEVILKTPNMKSLIHLIWDEVELWRNEKILEMMSPSGELLIDFVIESGDDRNLIAFLMPNLSNSEPLVNKKYFLKMQNQQYFDKTQQTLFERYLYIKDNKLREQFFVLCFYLLEESDLLLDIKKETCIEVALVLANIDEYRNDDATSLKENPAKDLIVKILDSQEGKAILETIKNDEEAKYDHEYGCDKLLKYFASYWSTEDKNYEEFKTKLIDHSPFFKMITYILEGKQKEFIENFHKHFEELVKNYTKRYNGVEENRKIIQKDLFILFRAAIKNDQKQILGCILDFENFETLNFRIPSCKKANESNHHLALKLLEHGYTLGTQKIPDDWITEQVMTEFVDNQIEVLDEDMIRMNTNFLLDPYDRKFKIKSKEDVDDQMLFWEYNGSLDFIVESKTLKDMIVHPLLSTYINLKTFKYQRVYDWNFALFFFMYLLPFGLLITYHSTDKMNKNLSGYFMTTLEILCTTSTFLLTMREFSQMVWILRTWKEYFEKISNWLELAMLVLSWILLAAIYFVNINEYSELIAFLSTILIILSTIEFLSMLPFPSIPLYMMMLKQVSKTFLKFFYFFVFILFSFSISFCVIFRPKNMNELENKNDSNKSEETYKNFDSLIDSFFKTLLMLSGEYTIEPFSLSPTQMIIFFFFVLTSFVLFNLILGLVIDDVQRLRTEAEILSLRYEANKFIESAATWKEFYDKFVLDNIDIKDLVWWKKFATKIMRWLVINYCFIHKIGKIYVNMNTREVSFEINRKQEAALTKYNGSVKKYFMDSDVFDRLKQILKDRSEKEFEASKQEFDQKKENDLLKEELKKQTELLNIQTEILNQILENRK